MQNETSFTVLNADNLGVFHTNKPNAIVRPLLRSEPSIPIEQRDSLNSAKIGDQNEERGLHSFAKELEKKLRRLKTGYGRDVSPADDHHKKQFLQEKSDALLKQRPLFITTVPTGVFLPPCNEPHYKKVYKFSTRPRVLENSREVPAESSTQKFSKVRSLTRFLGNFPKRELLPQNEPYRNVMFDRRVVRGSNFNQEKAMAEQDAKEREQLARRRQILRRRCFNKTQRNIIGTPPPVPGRKHEPIQTEKYLEELYDRPPEYDMNTQTDLFLERPISPPHIPAKIGVDKSTSIEDGELFDFDLEVQPVLETLVGKMVEQGLMEVAHEEEIAELRRQQEEYLALREADLAELRRLEAEELRLQAEKERRLRQDEIANELDAKMQERVTAAKLLQGHIASLIPEVLENLDPLSDAAKKEHLEKNICPWLSKEVAEEVGHIIDSREILTVIIQEIIKQRAAAYAGWTEPEDKKTKEIAPILEEEEEVAIGEDDMDGEEEIVEE